MAKRKAPAGAKAIERPGLGSPRTRDRLDGLSVEELADVTNALMDAIMVVERAMDKGSAAVSSSLEPVRDTLEREIDHLEHDLCLHLATTKAEGRILAEIAIQRGETLACVAEVAAHAEMSLPEH